MIELKIFKAKNISQTTPKTVHSRGANVNTLVFMIGFLIGTVLDLDTKKTTILTSGGVGYEVYPSLTLLGHLEKGSKAQLYVHTLVREQELSLYGFVDQREKQFFEKLIGISGIGPKIALQIVSSSVENFLRAVEEGDIQTITQTPGLGKKMAQKIVVELQGKINLQSESITSIPPQKQEAIEALISLGYDQREIEKVLPSAPENADSEALVRFFLQNSRGSGL
jgi:holliday junction DNA helicase RuvA